MRQLKVYGVNLNGHYRGIVAATSRTAAARAFGIKPYHMRDFGSETGNPEEVALALSRPGAVFQRAYGGIGAEWKEVVPAPAP